MATRETDLLIVGAGPAGLSAAINGASEGLDVLLMDSGPEIGGQALKSSKIENYPGFPRGISGTDLIGRFIEQAKKFHSLIECPMTAAGIRPDGDRRIVTTDYGEEIAAKVVILSAGLSYRRLNAPGIGSLMGRGVLYGAPTYDPRSMGNCTVCIVGGANSAGQAAMYMSKNPAARIKLLVRRPIEDQMSMYLVDRIRQAHNIEVCTGVEVTEVTGGQRLKKVMVQNLADKTTEIVDTSFLFIFIGASPKTQWLNGSVDVDERKFILTGSHIVRPWTLDRPPLSYETSMPGVFCCGDVRFGSKKRIASAIGEGAGGLQQCHEYLQMLEKK